METELETRRNVSTSSLTLAGQEVYNVTVSLYLIQAQYNQLQHTGEYYYGCF